MPDNSGEIRDDPAYLIYRQLTDYCDCVEETTQRDVDDMISVVSLATGWMQKPCEYFLKSERREVISLPSCMDCPLEFEPYYTPYEPDSFSFTLLATKELEETTTTLDFMFSEARGVFRVDTGLPSCECECDECGCPTEYRLIVDYTAGYELIPECLLPVFCNLIDVIHAKNSCDCQVNCGCDTSSSTYDEDGNITTAKIDYKSGDFVTVFLETDFGKMLVEQYKNQLGIMSLIRMNHNVWGMVV